MRAIRDSLGAFRDVLGNSDLRRLQLALIGSTIGAWAYVVAVSVYAYESGGAAAVGLIGLARWGAAALLTPYASLLADRYPRRLVMVCSDLGRAAALAGAAVVALADGPSFAVYGLTVVAAVANAPFRPAQAALLPSLARTPEELTASNVAATSIESVGMFGGPALGGLLLAATSPGVVFAATAGTLVWSALLVVRIRGGASVDARAESRPRFRKELLAGFSTIAREPRLRLLVALFSGQMLVDGLLSVLIVVIALRITDLGTAGVGWINGAIGIGGVAGAVAAAALVGRKRLAADFGLGIFLWGAPIALVAALHGTLAVLVLFALVGIGNTLVDVSGTTLLQRSAADEVLGRVFGVLETLSLVAVSLGAVLAPLLLAVLGDRVALVVAGVFLPLLALLSWGRLRAIDVAGTVPQPGLDLLRAIPIFAPLSPPTLERLAGALVSVHAAAGQVVVGEGDVGDRFYVVSSGRAEVTVRGEPVAELDAGDFFGEIALLRDVPRTATVRALDPLELLALEREDFLAAVTGHSGSNEAAEAIVGARVATAI